MEIVQRKVWVTILTCECGRSEEMWHYGEKEPPTTISYPSCGKWNGWDLIEEKCPLCTLIELPRLMYRRK